MMDLYRADRDALIQLVLAQREQLAAQAAQLARAQELLAAAEATAGELMQQVGELAQRVRELEDRPPPTKPLGLAGNTLGSARAASVKVVRKRRAANQARARMVPTARVLHALECCPDCDHPLHGGSVKWTREVIEVPPPAPVTVTEHVFVTRYCPRCQRSRTPSTALAGVIVGHSRLGVGLVSLIATLREAGRWPLRTIQWYLTTFHGVHLSVGALVHALKQVTTSGATTVDGILRQIRRSAVVNADETGWREDGVNGYVWSFSTPEARYFTRAKRTKAVLDEVLGDRFDGVLVSDFYAAYDHYPGVQQRCWAHLLRDADDLVARHPTDHALAAWVAGLRDLYRRAQATARGSDGSAARRQAQRTYEMEARVHAQPYLGQLTAPQRVLSQRISDYCPALFEFVLDPAIPATNNAAERALRHLVTCRKISGGTRSEEGSDTKMTLATLFGTWSAEGRNPFHACRQLLTDAALP
ncbi:MAG TPA: IS66 family transposase [Thermomicrobiales bacterium]|jgi:transposase|nr:IS66 family transposase [Thermomicrobiales bacterium]